MVALRFISSTLSDISPLGSLSALTILSLECREVEDLSPLLQLQALTEVKLMVNPTASFEPLRRLAKLKALTIDEDRRDEAISCLHPAIAEIEINGQRYLKRKYFATP